MSTTRPARDPFLLAYALQQLETITQPRPGRCRWCGVPDTPECKDETGACRFCRDGEATPF